MQEVLKIQSSGTNQTREKLSLNVVRDSAFRMMMGRSFHQHGTVNENVLESDFVALCDGTTSHRSLADHRLLVGM